MDKTLFPEMESPRPEHKKAGRKRVDIINDYEGFVDKFKPKLMTDDCYTPPEVYEFVK